MSATKRIALVLTGKLERAALPDALMRCFPGTEFASEGQYDGFTSADLSKPSKPPPPGVPSSVDQLINALADLTSRRLNQYDFAILVDDLELANRANPAAVVDYARASVRALTAPLSQRQRDQLRTRCSVHLLAPMVESWFFAEPAALVRAGVGRSTVVQRRPGDVEQFEATEGAFLSAPDESKEVRRKGIRRWATKASERARHPKSYLTYLTEAHPGGSPYQETTLGADALRLLAWSQLFANPVESCFARALVEDIAHMLGVANPYPGTTPPALCPPGSGAYLRNV